MKIEIITNRSGIFGGVRRLYFLAEYFIETGYQTVINIEDKSTNNWFQHSVPENQIIEPDVRIIPEVLQKKHPNAKNILYYQAHWDPPEGTYDKVITTSSFLQNQLLQYGYQSQIIKYGINFELFTVNESERIPGTIGYMPRKNKEEALLIKSMLPEFKFLEIDGINELQVSKLLQKCDIFLALSRVEGFGLTLPEAALCGALIIGYHAYGGTDWLNVETYVAATDPQDIIIKIKNAINLRLYEEKRNKARKIIIEKYSIQNEKKEWLELLNSLPT